MRIVFDATSVAKTRLGGIGTYGRELVRGCLRVAPGHDYVVAVRPSRWTKRHLVADLVPGAAPRLLLDHGHRLLLGAPVDVLHAIGVRLPAGGRFPRTVMLHDLNVFEFPELSEPGWRERRQRRIRQTVARADLIVSYSEHGAQALGEHLGVDRERVRVVPLGIDTERFRPRESDDHELAQALERRGLAGRPYVACIAQSATRKNQHGLLAAFARARLESAWRLLLAGPRGEDAGALRADAARRGLAPDRLALPGWVDDDEVPLLVAGAAFLCCPSWHEGFGLPVIEAQACGTPVVASDRAALPETLGDCGLAFDPADEDAFVAALERMASDEALRADCARRGPERVAAHYTWDHVARATLEVLAEAAGPTRG